MLPGLAVVVGAYLLGCFPTAVLVGRRAGFDPGGAGSRNPGVSNSFRLGGRGAGALVLAGDAGKGALATAGGLWLGGRGLGVAAGAAAVVGHIAPITRRFRGGKGVATATGMFAVLEPVATVAGIAAWLLVALATRTAALASIAMVVVIAVGVGVAGRSAGEVLIASSIAVLIALRHRGNLVRIWRGEEHSLDRDETRKPS